MEAKFTKEKWILRNQVAKYDVYSSMWLCIIESNENNVLQMVYSRTKEEAEANAKLIAAAPDMFEALIKISGLIDETSLPMTKVWDAIKKATE